MKLENFKLEELSTQEKNLINGGSFWYDLAFGVAYVGHAIYDLGKLASQYQHSLPANLKK